MKAARDATTPLLLSTLSDSPQNSCKVNALVDTQIASLSRSPGTPNRDTTEARFLTAPPVFLRQCGSDTHNAIVAILALLIIGFALATQLVLADGINDLRQIKAAIAISVGVIAMGLGVMFAVPQNQEERHQVAL